MPKWARGGSKETKKKQTKRKKEVLVPADNDGGEEARPWAPKKAPQAELAQVDGARERGGAA